MKTVPVRHQGKTIGHADIDEDGVIHATIDSSKLDAITRRRLLGPAGEFSISPHFIESPKAKGRKW